MFLPFVPPFFQPFDNAQVIVLDTSTGTVSIGDGIIGSSVPSGQIVVTGGGVNGNTGPSALHDPNVWCIRGAC